LEHQNRVNEILGVSKWLTDYFLILHIIGNKLKN
jgi:hypothetical protein